MDDELTITLSRDQALVLSDWFDRLMGTDRFDDLVDEDKAVWSPIYKIAGTLETTLAEVFLPDYAERLGAARERLLDTLGTIGRPELEEGDDVPEDED